MHKLWRPWWHARGSAKVDEDGEHLGEENAEDGMMRAAQMQTKSQLLRWPYHSAASRHSYFAGDPTPSLVLAYAAGRTVLI